MAAAGMEVAKDLDGMQVMGFWEVAKQYGFFKKVFYRLLDRVKQERPAALVCIDYPGFNLRFAKEVRKLGIPCLYYIVPQVWAWKPHRAAKMAEHIDRAYCVFEFEPPFFEKFRSRQRKMKTVFVGHPLLDCCCEATALSEGRGADESKGRLSLPEGPKTVAFLPGSREAEVNHHFDAILGVLESEREKTDRRFLVSMAAGIRQEWDWNLRYVAEAKDGETAWDYMKRMGLVDPNQPLPDANLRARVLCVSERRVNALELGEAGKIPHATLLPSLADFSVVKSGTSTLEAGLQGKPMCVVYRGSWASYAIARMLVDIPVFSLVNIVLGRYAVPELLQGEVTAHSIANEIQRGLSDQGYIEAQRKALAELPGRLGGPGASQRAAKAMLDFLAGRE